jgi:hypothetical protein
LIEDGGGDAVHAASPVLLKQVGPVVFEPAELGEDESRARHGMLAFAQRLYLGVGNDEFVGAAAGQCDHQRPPDVVKEPGRPSVPVGQRRPWC